MAGDHPARGARLVDPWLVAGGGIAILSLAVYRATLMPGLGAWDNAEAQTVLPLLGTMHPTGFPAYVVLGWVVANVLRPLGSPAFLINLLSALLTAFAVGTSVLVARRLGVGLVVAVAAAACFALTPIVWHIAVAADAHALHLALLVAVVLGLLRWESLVTRRLEAPDDERLRARGDRAIVITAAVFGLAVANHALSLLLLPAIGLFVLAVEPRVVLRPRLVVTAVGACLGVAALLYLELPLRAGPLRAPLVYGHPETWGGFLDTVLARQFQGSVGGLTADIARKAGDLVFLAAAQLGPLVALLPAGLLVTAVRRPRYALLSATATAITCLFAASYSNAAIDRYYLGPAFFAWTWLAVLLGAVVDRVRELASPAADEASGPTAAQDDSAAVEAPQSAEPATALDEAVARSPQDAAPPPAGAPVSSPGPEPRRASGGLAAWRSPATVTAVILSVALLVPTATQLDARWREADRSGETWESVWLDQAFTSMKPDAMVISWWSYSTPMWYGQLVEGLRPDIWIVDDRTRVDLNLGEIPDLIDANLGKRPVYLIRLQESDVIQLTDRFVIEPVGRPTNLFEVTGRQETSP